LSGVVFFIFLLVLIAGLGSIAYVLYRKNMHIWIWSYVTQRKEPFQPGEPVHILFAFCDHFEPKWGNASYEKEVERVVRWCKDYPDMAAKHKDADGNHPKHSFFYPQEEYRKEHLDDLVQLCRSGFGEIEIHLHHDNDTAAGLREKITEFLRDLVVTHNAVPLDSDRKPKFAFIHGNWALDNSRKDGRWCGVDNELAVLSQLGCYADFTLPSAPSDTQTSKVNSIYYAQGRNGESKSHNWGVDVEAGKSATGDLMIIQGPLCLNWKERKFGLFPRIENSDIRLTSPPSENRVDLWIKCAIRVRKQPQWLFVKVHTHGTQEMDMDTLLGEPVDKMFTYLGSKYNDGSDFVLHYVTAREMYNMAVAAQAGKKGDPNQYRDFEIKPPGYFGNETCE